jgi:hypothetical protein
MGRTERINKATKGKGEEKEEEEKRKYINKGKR